MRFLKVWGFIQKCGERDPDSKLPVILLPLAKYFNSIFEARDCFKLCFLIK